MSSQNELGCQCGPCPTNIDKYGYETEWEDQSFLGTQCIWHKHIRGKLGCISPDIVKKRPAIFVQFFKPSFYVSKRAIDDWHGLEIVESVSSRKEGSVFIVTLNKDSFTTGVSETSFWAELMGAKSKKER